MILYFNKVGRLLERLEYACEEYGDTARVGTTNFKIFAYFENVDDYSEYSIATIRFRRPDLVGSEYPDLFMVKKNDFEYDSSVEASKYFKEQDNPYSGFIFDFSSVMSGNTHVKLLDAPGIWEASITLQAIGKANVTGLVRFTVKGAVSASDEEETELDASVIINNIIPALINDYVPYLGAVKNIDLGNHGITAGFYSTEENSQGINYRIDEDGIKYVASGQSLKTLEFPGYEGGDEVLATQPYISDDEPNSANNNKVWFDITEEEESIIENNYSNRGINNYNNGEPLIDNNYGNENCIIDDNYGEER